MTVMHAPRPPVLFAHASEAEIARLLDFYGIHWQYEPRSFPLEWSEDGRPTQSFTPDFYLPDYDLYLEVTTVRPSLINRKNRKLRKLREHYPEVNIKLLTLKDVEALFLKYGTGPGDEGISRMPDAERQTDNTLAQKDLSEESSLADCNEGSSHTPTATTAPTNAATNG